jgi:4-amino-4-deoxy-L-arabinose transferase-like glycosyltransferase
MKFSFAKITRQGLPYAAVLAVWMVFLLLFRLHNSLAFNPYWGYDGGGHVDYLLSLVRDGRMPSIDGNYIAWHEPLYYLAYAAAAKLVILVAPALPLLKFFGVLQALLSVVVSLLAWRMASLLTSNRWTALAVAMLFSLLPPMNQASTFLTNELLNIFFILLLSHCFIRRFASERRPVLADFLLLGAVAGLALVTKVTAVIPVVVIFVLLIATAALRRDRRFWRGALAALALAFVIVLPWQVYRSRHVLSGLSINNTLFLQPKPLALDSRLRFYAKFDADIFAFPYWPSGGRSFWSMLYADSFYDYYGSLENRDQTAYLVAHDRGQLTRTTSRPDYVLRSHATLARLMAWLGLPLAALLLLGFWRQAVEAVGFVRRRGSVRHVYALGLSGGLLAAALYFSYRYPYPDAGTVKSIFTAPLYLFGLAYGLEAVAKKDTRLFGLVSLLLAGYVALAALSSLVVKFNY